MRTTLYVPGVLLGGVVLAAGCDLDLPPGTTLPDSHGGGVDDGDDGANGTSGASDDDSSTGPDEPDTKTGAVFTLENPAGKNAVLMFHRDGDGRLEEVGSFRTGGHGTGQGLGSQGALAIEDGYLYAVNPGDATLSSLAIGTDQLQVVDVVHTGGDMPTSVTVRDGRAYVLNASGAGSVRGFAVTDGLLKPIAGAFAALSGADPTAPAQVGLTPDGSTLIVTERATNQIVTYDVRADGSLGAPNIVASEGDTPFGFDFTSSGFLLVSEAFGGAPGASAVSSYDVLGGGGLMTLSASVPNGQAAACWVEIVGDRFAYTTNTGSNNISGYDVAADGSLTLFGGDGVVADLGDDQGPIDMALSDDEAYLYVINAAGDEIRGFEVQSDGSLSDLNTTVAVPETAVGLIGF